MEFINFFLHHWLLSLAFILVLGLLIQLEFFEKRQGTKTLSLNDAITLLNHQQGVLIDIRPLALYKQSHIQGAKHCLMTEEADLSCLPANKDTAIVLIDQNGLGVQQAGAFLKQQGFKNVYNLQGGMLNWLNANMPTVKEA